MINSNDCTGCGACVNICARHAIKLQDDENRCLVAKVDPTKCIDCNACTLVCPRQNERTIKKYESRVYGAFNKDLRIRTKSTSGGIFTLLAEKIISEGGVVAGVAMDDNIAARFCIATQPNEIEKFRKSKYVQAYPGDIYLQVKYYLLQGTTVLFTGLPCQIHALKLYLNKEYNNLICVDLICYGVVPPTIFADYVKYKEKKKNKKILEYRFRERDAIKGWHKAVMTALYDDGSEELIRSSRDYYFGLFFKNIAHRESCFSCKYKTKEREGDITLGDFWGIDKIDSSFDSNDGISLVMTNTEKGDRVFALIDDKIEKREYDKSALNVRSTTTTNVPYKYRKQFFKMYNKFGFSVACFWHVSVYRLISKLPIIKLIYR